MPTRFIVGYDEEEEKDFELEEEDDFDDEEFGDEDGFGEEDDGTKPATDKDGEEDEDEVDEEEGEEGPELMSNDKLEGCYTSRWSWNANRNRWRYCRRCCRSH